MKRPLGRLQQIVRSRATLFCCAIDAGWYTFFTPHYFARNQEKFMGNTKWTKEKDKSFHQLWVVVIAVLFPSVCKRCFSFCIALQTNVNKLKQWSKNNFHFISITNAACHMFIPHTNPLQFWRSRIAQAATTYAAATATRFAHASFPSITCVWRLRFQLQ